MTDPVASAEAAAPVLPAVNDRNRPFWEGGLAGELRFQRCGQCSHLRYPVSSVCPRCLSGDARWEGVSGRGRVLTYAVFDRAYHPSRTASVPYVVAIVQTDEGPRMISDLVDCHPEEVTVDAPVEVVFDRAPDGSFAIPRFRLAGRGDREGVA